MSRSKYRNLVIIGNGFDRWQDLPTSYEDFRLFYLANVDRIMSELGFSKHTVTDVEGHEKTVSAVELVYGNPFHPEAMPNEFFWYFESSLDKLDDQQLNLYFGRSEEGISNLSRLVDEAQKTLRTAFCRWVTSLDITPTVPQIHFPENCFFIDFNYTDTLEKRFGINSRDIYHIHGNAKDPDSIIVGHATHPETAFRELIEQHFMKSVKPGGLPRFIGLYAIEDALYRTDKHVEDNIDLLCAELMQRGVHIEDFENVYVLGHSFSDPDIRYFEYLDRATRCGCDYDSLSAAAGLDLAMLMIMSQGQEDVADGLLLQMIQLNIEYAIHHRERVWAEAPSLYPDLDAIDQANGITYNAAAASAAVKQRFLFEQAGRTSKLLKELANSYGLPNVPEGCHSVLGLADYVDMGHDPRRKNATWHISYLSPSDEKRIRKVMKKLGLKRYTLHHGIDRCVEGLKGR